MSDLTYVDTRRSIGVILTVSRTIDPDDGEEYAQVRVRFEEHPGEGWDPAFLEARSPRIGVRKNPQFWVDLQDWLTRFTVEKVMDLLDNGPRDHVMPIRPETRRAFSALMVDADRWLVATLIPE